MTTFSQTAERRNIADSLKLLLPPGAVTELRIPNTPRGTVSGYFDDLSKLAAEAGMWSGKAPGIYFTLNPVNSALLARAHNRLVEHAKQTTSDTDILRRIWLPLDFDPIRPAGVSSTDTEHEAALTRAREAGAWLRTLGITAVILADSGNGAHALVPIDLPNDADSTTLVKRCIEAVALRFSDDRVAVDLGVANAGRIWKGYGTLACKGDSTPDRPHRRACILEAPSTLIPEPRELLEKLASLSPAEPKAAPRQSDNGRGSFDLARWIADHNLHVIGPHPWQGGRKWIFPVCPWSADHTNKAAFLVQFASGAIAAGCHHNGCHGKGWHDLRDAVEPGWRERRTKTGQEDGESPNPWALAKDAPSETKQQGLQWYTIGQLREETSAEIRYLVDGLLAESSLSVIGGKIAVGKSTLARTLAYCVTHGVPFLGRETQKGAVLYVAPEESKHGVMADLAALGFSDEDPLHLCFGSSATVLEQVLAKMQETHARLVIFETIFRVLRIKDVNDYAQATAKLDPVLALARQTSAHALFTHHLGKRDTTDPLDALLGSTAIGGTPDTRIVIKRKDDVRTIEVIQRYGQPLPETVLHYNAETKFITPAGSKHDFDKQKVKTAILDILPGGEEGLTEKEITEQVEGRTRLKREALRELVAEGPVKRLGKGGKGDPFQYALKDSCFLVPDIGREQGNTNPENGASPQQDLPYSCSPDSEKFADSGESREQESCRFCHKPDCPLTLWGSLCRLSEANRQRGEELQAGAEQEGEAPEPLGEFGTLREADDREVF